METTTQPMWEEDAVRMTSEPEIITVPVPAETLPVPKGYVPAPAPYLEDMRWKAKHLCNTDFVPKYLRGKPEAVMGCMLYGRALGLDPMVALKEVMMVEGKPSLSAHIIRERIFARGHRLVITSYTDDAVTVRGERINNDKVVGSMEVTWTIEDAQRAGLMGNPAWKKFPRQMLANRCTTEIGRQLFPDVFGGSVFTHEELDRPEPESWEV